MLMGVYANQSSLAPTFQRPSSDFARCPDYERKGEKDQPRHGGAAPGLSTVA